MRAPDVLIRDTEPFPASVIKQLPPRNDDYVPWTHYAQRVLLHNGGYSWEPLSVMHADQKWVVIGHLTIADERYGGVGEDDSSPTSAESNAFKRACAKAGIGLHLYQDFWLHDRLVEEGNKT